MDSNQTDVDPQNINPLSNEELTKLVIISNRMVGRLSTQLASVQAQLNELSKVIVESRLIDSAKLNALVGELQHATETVVQEPIPVVADLPITNMNPRDSQLLGTSIAGGSSGVVNLPKPPVVPPAVVVNETSE